MFLHSYAAYKAGRMKARPPVFAADLSSLTAHGPVQSPHYTVHDMRALDITHHNSSPKKGLRRVRAASGKLIKQPSVSRHPSSGCSLQELRAALDPTPIPQTSYDTLGGGGHRSAWSTWFEVAHPLAPFNRATEVRPASRKLSDAPCLTLCAAPSGKHVLAQLLPLFNQATSFPTAVLVQLSSVRF